MPKMMKLSRQAKKRFKRMSSSERKAVLKAAELLADVEAITSGRYEAIRRTLKSCYSGM